MYNAYITKVKNIRPAENSDNLNLCTVFGTTVVVGKDINETDLYIYFPSDGQLSVEYCAANDLVRRKDENGNPAGGYLDPNKRNVTAIRLRGNRSDGLIMPLSSLAFTGIDISTLKEGDNFTLINGVEICRKYIPRSNKRASNPSEGNRTRKKKIPVAPLFIEHADTEQLAYNLADFYTKDEVEITLKMHGTSQRTGYLPVFKGYKKTFLDWLFRKEGKPIYEWGYVSGTRRTILENFEGGFYGSNAFREVHSKKFEGKLWKGETVYYEVVGFTDTGVPIMGSANNKKLNDKEFIKQYGETTVYSYGCSPTGLGDPEWYWDEEETQPAIYPIVPQSDIYVYRMTMTNEDGQVVEYTPDFMRYRCEQMGIKTVPIFWKGFIPERLEISPGEWIVEKAEEFYDGPDPIGKTHVREGVVCRILNRPKFTAYKHKNFSFKVLEGIAKVDAEAPDLEEAEELIEE